MKKESIGSFCATFGAYTIVSFFALVFTTGGWNMMAEIMYGSLFYGAILLFLIEFFVKQKKAKKHPYVSYSMRLFGGVIILQVIALLLNVGDCGDGEGSFSFFQKLMGTNGWEMCNTGREASVLSILFFPLFMLYSFVMVFFLRKTTRSVA